LTPIDNLITCLALVGSLPSYYQVSERHA